MKNNIRETEKEMSRGKILKEVVKMWFHNEVEYARNTNVQSKTEVLKRKAWL